MKKRDFLKTTAILSVGAAFGSLISCNDNNSNNPSKEETKDTAEASIFELPALDYGFDALEPHIDALTMEIHHGKHHAGYTKNFNAALEGSNLATKPLSEILAGLKDNDADKALRNNGGGFYNHQLFWKVIGPNKGGEPIGDLAAAINQTFGSFENFSTQFKDAAKTRFGSGWAWLSVDANKKLIVSDTPNQDNPLMSGIVSQAGTPILGLDVWEHAYYLNYQNRRADYINAFFNLINWETVAKNFVNAS